MKTDAAYPFYSIDGLLEEVLGNLDRASDLFSSVAVDVTTGECLPISDDADEASKLCWQARTLVARARRLIGKEAREEGERYTADEDLYSRR